MGQQEAGQQPVSQQGTPMIGGTQASQGAPVQRTPESSVRGGASGRRPRGRSLLRPVSVDDVVAEDVVTVEPGDSVRVAVSKLADRDVGSVVVVEDDRPVGVLTDRTIALALEEYPDVADRTVEELIDGDLVSVDADTDIFETLQLMRDEGIRRLPVVDDEGSLRGIVTLDDALVLLASELDKLATTVREQSPRL